MKISAVVFDIGNVLIGWTPTQFFDAKIGADRRRAFFDAVPILAANAAIDRGSHFPDTIVQLVDQHPDWEAEITLWHTCWLDMVSPVITRSVKLLRALRRQGVPVFALSNFGAETFEIAKARYPFLAEFDQHYISGVMRIMKPDPEIYAALEQGSGLAPETLLFVDDLSENIAAAAARGWQVHLFDGPQGWADCLVAHGLLSEEQAQ
ncbi:HAD family phosphatase [Paracoccaceae bacterium]|nr:HAD family phosphatase [Paracoccaceae bacterium]